MSRATRSRTVLATAAMGRVIDLNSAPAGCASMPPRRDGESTMRAAVLYEPNTPMRIEDISLDGPRADEVLVQVRATGACHSDYHVMDGSWHGPNYPTPVVLGHEAAGVVEEVGGNV